MSTHFSDRCKSDTVTINDPFDTPEHVEFRNTIRTIIEKEFKPKADTWDEASEILWELHRNVVPWVSVAFELMSSAVARVWTTVLHATYNEEFAMCGANGVTAALNSCMISINPIHNSLTPT